MQEHDVTGAPPLAEAALSPAATEPLRVSSLSGNDPSREEEIQRVIAWCTEQAESIMSISAGCATTHGDPGGGLEMVNSIASDIAINLQMLASEAGLRPVSDIKDS